VIFSAIFGKETLENIMGSRKKMHRIIGFIKTLDSMGSVTICGVDGCYVEYRDSYGNLNKCNIYWEFQNDKILGIASSLQVTPESNLFQMLMQAKASQLKVELGVVFNTESIMIHTVKLI
jgi:hypothetical protein